MRFSVLSRPVILFVAALPLTGCLFRARKVEVLYSKAPLKTATQQQLLDYINTQASKIQSLQATVDIDTSVGGVKNGKVTDYQQIRGYVLVRKPAMLRMMGNPPAAPGGSDQEHVCPMHPDVRQRGPGRCPTCGMDLVPTERAPSAEHDH